MLLSVGDKVSPYQILVPIAVSGLSEVFEARDTRLNRTVAVKVMPK